MIANMIKMIKGKPRSLLSLASITFLLLNSTNEKTVAILKQGIQMNQTIKQVDLQESKKKKK